MRKCSQLKAMAVSKVLILVLYSQQPVYQAMKTYLCQYYFNHPLVIQGLVNVKFYSFGSISNSFVETSEEIIFQGDESFIPGILDKTIKAFKHFYSKDYDFILRSNISTVVDISTLFHELNQNNSFDYGGSHIHTIKELSSKVGITDNSLIGKTFVSGTAILFSRKAMEKLLSTLDNFEKFGFNIIDDVALGLWMYELGFCPVQFKSLVNVDSISENVLFYRNKRIVHNRANDIIAISKLCNQLSKLSELSRLTN